MVVFICGRIMKQIMIIGANIGLTGCQIIQRQEASIVLNKAGLDLIDTVGSLQRVAKYSIIEKKSFKIFIGKAGEALGPFREPIKEKKPKYIRQQHKLAQRHYSRK